MTKPTPYQLSDIPRIDRFGGRALLAWSMGVGKTYEALFWAVLHPKARPMVVVCPASVKYVWESEARHHFGLRAEVLEGTRSRGDGLAGKPQLVVLNYDILSHRMEYLLSLRPQLVVFDESQYLMSRSALRTKQARVLCHNVPHVLCLSGTPILNRPADLWPSLNILRPDKFPGFWAFAMKFCGARRTFYGWDVRGSSNADELFQLLTKTVMIRRKKEDVLKDLPPKRRSIVPLEIRDRTQYDKAVDDFLGWLRQHAPGKLSRAARAERLVQLGYLKRLAARLKLRGVYDWVDSYLRESEGKLILFAVHKKIIKRLRERYEDDCVVIDGSVTGRKRRLAEDQFKTRKDCRILIGQIKAAGVGLNLQCASDVAFVELGWNPATMDQAESRAHRMGQKNEVACYYLLAKDSIETRLLKLLQDKQKVSSAIIDGKKDVRDFDLHDRLSAMLLGKGEKPCQHKSRGSRGGPSKP